MMLTVEERLRLCHQGTAWHGDLIKKQLTELAELLAASERSDAESLAMRPTINRSLPFRSNSL